MSNEQMWIVELRANGKIIRSYRRTEGLPIPKIGDSIAITTIGNTQFWVVKSLVYYMDDRKVILSILQA